MSNWTMQTVGEITLLLGITSDPLVRLYFHVMCIQKWVQFEKT